MEKENLKLKLGQLYLREDNTLWFNNRVHIGEVLCGDDGFYTYWPKTGGGGFNEFILKELYNLLEEMNREWWGQITEYMTNDARENT